MMKSNAGDAAARLPEVRCPTLLVMGSDDSDFADPAAEAAAIADLLPAGLGRHEMIEGAGHYPHAQYPQRVADVVLPFLAEHAHG
jgi:pimeloyl-ACP methyl ester carboxylesterase